jgi:transcription antitermination factor NusG
MNKGEVHWYAVRVKYQTEKKVKAYLAEKEIEHFIPFQTFMVEKDGKVRKKEKPVIPGLVFLRTIEQTAQQLPVESKVKIVFLRNIETGKYLIVPDKQMQDFMFLLDFSDAAIRVENTNLRRGDRVRVIKGDFAGIEGELVRIKGHKRVVVRLEGLFSLATTYIPGSYLERIGVCNEI